MQMTRQSLINSIITAAKVADLPTEDVAAMTGWADKTNRVTMGTYMAADEDGTVCHCPLSGSALWAAQDVSLEHRLFAASFDEAVCRWAGRTLDIGTIFLVTG